MTDHRPARRVLPLLPNADHLRKQAKVRLSLMRQTAPGARLTEAQSLLAHEYGFSDWQALQSEVTRRAAEGPRQVRASLRQANLALLPENRFQAASEADCEVYTPADFLRFGMMSQTACFVLAFSIVLIVFCLAQGQQGIVASLAHWSRALL